MIFDHTFQVRCKVRCTIVTTYFFRLFWEYVVTRFHCILFHRIYDEIMIENNSVFSIIFSGRAFEGSHKDQPVAVGTGQCDLGVSGWEEFTHPVPRLQTDPSATGLTGRQR